MDFMELSSQVVLQSYGQFLDVYTRKLQTSLDNFSNPWDSDHNFITLQIIDDDHCKAIDYMSREDEEQTYIIQLFIELCKEVHELKRDLINSFLSKLRFTGEVYIQQAEAEGRHVLLKNVIPVYFELLAFVKRCRTLLTHILDQLARLYNSKPNCDGRNHKELDFINLQMVYEAIGDLLLIFIAIDSSVACYHKDIHMNWEYLKQNIYATSYKTKPNSHEVKHLLKIMGEIYSELLTGMVFHNTLQTLNKERARFEPSPLSSHLVYFLLNQSKEFEYVDECSCQAIDNCAKVVAIFVLASYLFEVKDKKIHKFVVGFSKKFLAIALFCQVFWSPSEFISRNLDSFSSELKINHLHSNLASYTEEYSKNLCTKLKDFMPKVLHWSLKMENCTSMETQNVKLNDMEVINLCFEGLQLCNDMKYLICSASRFYYFLHLPVPKSVALAFCRYVELLKTVHYMFERHTILINKTSNHAIQKVALRILNKIINSKKVLSKDSSSKKSDTTKRLHAILSVAEKIFYGACTEDKIYIINMLPVLPCNLVDLEYTYTLMKFYCTQLETLCNLRTLLFESSSNLFGVAESNILPLYVKHLRESDADVSRIKFLLDPSIWDERYAAGAMSTSLVQEGKALVKTEITHPLSQDFETRLRLLAHSHLSHDNNFPTSVKDYRKLFRIEPLIMGKSFFSPKHEIERYLERTFHDLLTVSLHDWQTYREMRVLAEQKFGLSLVEDSLPCQSLSLNLDVLEIMRNIHIFVSKYLYDMNNQTFVELSSNNKHLNTISIQHIASSIRTHGTGIMNTTTNFIYQFLRRKILAFLQFLFDDNIKSRLMKDMGFLNGANPKKLYTFDRAEKFIKSLSRLGVNEEGLPWLDQFRVLVTQIGNALGYVRMVRSGGQHHCLEAASFLPKLLPTSFDCSNLSLGTVGAINSFQEILANILHNLCQGTEYLQLLVEVFARVFQSADSIQVNLFVLTIPPLTINFVQHMVSCKERINKRSKQGGKYSDDGFPMGIAYLLRMLNLTSDFDSLHWFETVMQKYASEEQLYMNSSTDLSDRSENTRQLSLKNLEMYRQEFELLMYNIKSAKIIFQGH